MEGGVVYKYQNESVVVLGKHFTALKFRPKFRPKFSDAPFAWLNLVSGLVHVVEYVIIIVRRVLFPLSGPLTQWIYWNGSRAT